jgi:bifunctional diaminopimelate decarboxylase / aspartate kinase
MIVCKFGGTSVADGPALQRLAAIVRERLDRSPLVVVSALAGVSDGLLHVLGEALEGRDDASRTELDAIAARHHELLAGARAPQAELRAAGAAVAERIAMLESLRRGVILLGDASPWVRARFVAAGELLSSHIVTAVLVGAGIEATWFDARDVVCTDGVEPERDRPDPSEVGRRVGELLGPRLCSGSAVVTQGFIGSARDGRTTLLGRGGSDYTASLLGRALRAQRIEIWTDVDGVLTANPRVVPEARRVRLLSFVEAGELAYFGAKVLHPETLWPAVEANIPVWVGNARRPRADGTTILAEAPLPSGYERWVVKSIAHKRGLTLVNVHSMRMLMAHGFLARIFKVFDAHRTSVDLVATSEVSVSLTVDDDSRLAAILEELESFSRVEVERGMTLVCLVGDGMRGKPGLPAEVFRAIPFSRIRMITQGASSINLSLVVPEADLEATVRALHTAFFSGSLPAAIFGESFLDLEQQDRPTTEARPPGPVRIQGLLLREIAQRSGTPVYVYDLEAIAERAERLRRALPVEGVRLFYACKANAHPAILRTLGRAGVGVEAASPGEVERALAAGHPAERVVMSATNARPEALARVLDRGAQVTAGSESELRRLARIRPGSEVLLRVNPGVGDGHHPNVVTGGVNSKFGVPLEELEPAIGAATAAGLRIRGIHAHIGSGIFDPLPLLTAADRLLAAAEAHRELEVVDLGGGLGIPYRSSDPEFDIERFGQELAARLAAFRARCGHVPEIWLEPGRYLVGPAGWLLAEVICRKVSGGLTFIGVDTGMNHLLRPALYGAHHRVVNLSAPDAPVEWVEVVGNVCETTDVLASNRPLARAEEGHLLAFCDAGAYGYSMASSYNLWPLPKELAFEGGREVG